MTRGARLWAELHTKRDVTPAFLQQFTKRIPCAECQAEWVALTNRIPPAFGPGWFAWTVEAHNAVNARLNKPKMSLEDARRLWRPEEQT